VALGDYTLYSHIFNTLASIKVNYAGSIESRAKAAVEEWIHAIQRRGNLGLNRTHRR